MLSFGAISSDSLESQLATISGDWLMSVASDRMPSTPASTPGTSWEVCWAKIGEGEGPPKRHKHTLEIPGTKGAPATFFFFDFLFQKSGDYYYSFLLFFEIVVLVVLHLAFGTRQLYAKWPFWSYPFYQQS